MRSCVSKRGGKVVLGMAFFCLAVTVFAISKYDICIKMAQQRKARCLKKVTTKAEKDACLTQYETDTEWCAEHAE